MKKVRLFLLGVCSLGLLACSSQPSRYQHKQDFTPQKKLNVQALQEPKVQYEPLSRRGNPESYVVFGKRYSVMKSAKGYQEEGEASWYGMKFHGHETSNGEIYDVYQFTAAHKSLPLPTYVRVTRVDTGKSVIVRVNDRGPFHGKRIIDLSYAAAIKLGIDKVGVARVRVEALEPEKPFTPVVSPTNEKTSAAKESALGAEQRWIQVGAFAELNSALKLQRRLEEHLMGSPWPIVISRSEQVHRVRIGPVPLGKELEQVLSQLEAVDITDYHLLKTAY